MTKDVIRESLIDFKNVEHRLERFIKVHGIEYINDSKATNVNSTWYALESMTKPTIWIVGGIDKGNDYSALLALVKEKVTTIICLGDEVKNIHEAFQGYIENIVDAKSMEEAVKDVLSIRNEGRCCFTFSSMLVSTYLRTTNIEVMNLKKQLETCSERD